MSGIFHHAASLGYINVNVNRINVNVNPIKLAKVLTTQAPPEETAHYTVPEMAAALSVLRDEPQARVAMALAFIGLRPTEIPGVKREDVDLEAGVLYMPRSVWRGIINEGGKGKRSRRAVTLGLLVIRILSEYMGHSRSQRGFLLENGLGNPLDIDALARRVIRPAFTAAGLEWKGYRAGRSGAVTKMNHLTHGNTQVVSAYFGQQSGSGRQALHESGSGGDQSSRSGIG
jgi:integrase